MAAPGLVALSWMRRRWAALVLLGVVAGVVAGLATAAVAGERRSTSAAQRLADATSAPDGLIRPRSESGIAGLVAALADDPDVVATRQVASSIGRTTEAKDWYFPIAGPDRSDEISRPLLRAGRLPAPDSSDEVAVSAATAQGSGLRVGSVVDVDIYTNEQMAQISSTTEDQPAGSRLRLEVVGVLADSWDVAPVAAQRQMIASPAFYRRIVDGTAGCPSCDNAYRGVEVRTRDGAAGFDRMLERLEGRLGVGALDVQARSESTAAARPSDGIVRTGTWIMAVVVALVGGVVLAQLVRRELASRSAEDTTLRILGLTRSERVRATAASSVLGAVVAAAVVPVVAIAVSPSFPVGRARLLEPSPGVHVDVPVVVTGAACAAVAFVAMVAVLARLEVARRPARRAERADRRVSVLPSSVPSVQTGLRVALGSDRRARTRPFRTAVVGAAVGTVGLVGSLVFLHSLDRLVGTPSMYGVDADLSIEVPEGEVGTRSAALAADPDLDAVVVQWSTVGLTVDGEGVDAVALDPVRGATPLTVLGGRGAVGPSEVVLGPAMADELEVGVGDEVVLAGGPGRGEVRAVVVGIGLDPQVMGQGGPRVVVVSMADLDRLVEPVAGRDPYPVIVVRYAAGVDAVAMTAEIDRRYPYGVMDESHPSPPPLLVALDAVRTVPTVFVWFFAGLVVVAVLNGVVVSGRQARHEMGILRSLGFTSSQLGMAMVVAGVTIAAVSLVVGVPLGLLVGAAAWIRVAERVDVLAVVALPSVAVAVVVAAVVLVGAIGALWPARWVIARRPAQVLRVE